MVPVGSLECSSLPCHMARQQAGLWMSSSSYAALNDDRRNTGCLTPTCVKWHGGRQASVFLQLASDVWWQQISGSPLVQVLK